MGKKNSLFYIVSIILILASLSCGLFGRVAGKDEPPAEPARLEITRQWASSASASSEYDNPDWSADQATGAPDTLECGDTPTAWASYGKFTVEWLEVRYDTAVTPTEINIYESHTPTQAVRVEALDTDGGYHQVYTADPQMASECPYILSVSVRGAEYQAIGVKVTIDQSQLEMPWDEIDAVELVGYGEAAVAEQPVQPTGVVEPMQSSEPESLGEPTQPVATSGGDALDVSSGKWTTYSTVDGLPHNDVHAVAVGNDGTLWFASGLFGEMGISSFKNGAFTNYDVSVDGLPVSVTHHGLAIGPDGTVWVATGTSLAYFDGQDWGFFTKQDGLPDDRTRSVAVAPDGTLWVGSVDGVSHYDGRTWTLYTPDDGLIDNFIDAIAIDADGNPWLVSSFDGVSYFDGGKWKSYYKGEVLPDISHRTVAIGSAGSVWVGSSGGGVSRFNGQDWTLYTVSDEYDLEYVITIVKGPDGSMWLAAEGGNGVYRFDGQTWMNFKEADGLCDSYVDSLAFAPDGSIWFGCRNSGITHFEP
jgi:hypothetical protein